MVWEFPFPLRCLWRFPSELVAISCVLRLDPSSDSALVLVADFFCVLSLSAHVVSFFSVYCGVIALLLAPFCCIGTRPLLTCARRVSGTTRSTKTRRTARRRRCRTWRLRQLRPSPPRRRWRNSRLPPPLAVRTAAAAPFTKRCPFSPRPHHTLPRTLLTRWRPQKRPLLRPQWLPSQWRWRAPLLGSLRWLRQTRRQKPFAYPPLLVARPRPLPRRHLWR